jgi:hypothetical protein
MNRTLEQVEIMLKNTPAWVCLVDVDSNKMVGFARALTDGIFKALIEDVIVIPEYHVRYLIEIF